MCDRKDMIKNVDMLGEMQQDSVEYATQELDKYNTEDTAAHIKECDKTSQVSRRNFGNYLTPKTKHFIYFCLGQVAILLFKSG
ncbi:dynein light chain 1, cytoplasmic-like [Manis javanica]|uniref:dynein light chain 1, cytoplasmic-like n=1 Tax=Manis javanica TaxID=9974 RepID=UPI00081312F1|nr:dynein light chain 1, cytoplasmic-like [Manis javanica]